MSTSESVDERIKLSQLRKLQLDIESLERVEGWSSRVPRLLPLITIVIAVAGFLWGVYTYNHQENVRRAADLEGREREIKKRFWEEQLITYHKISQSASRLATMDAGVERDKEYQTFRQLYHGDVIMFADKDVVEVIRNFLQKYLDYNANRPDLQGEIDRLSRQLAIACRESLKRNWNIPLEEIKLSQTS